MAETNWREDSLVVETETYLVAWKTSDDHDWEVFMAISIDAAKEALATYPVRRAFIARIASSVEPKIKNYDGPMP
jgi:hypothetical protein